MRYVDRLRYRVARRLLGLPASWQLRFSGGAPIVLDGEPLDPGLQFLLALRRRRVAVPLPDLTPVDARRRSRGEADAVAGPPVPVRSVTELTVDGADGQLAARHYAPDEPGGPHPLLVFLHGGGFVIGDLQTHDQACRLLARHAGVHVLSVDYRLAPEHPFPAAGEDAWAAFRWAAENAERLGADPGRLAIGGDSAGGNLSAVVAQRTARSGGPAVALQLLFYPATDRAGSYPSLDLFADGFFLTRDEIDWFHRNYSVGVDALDPRLSPLRGADLSGLAPALVVTAGFDPLRDEGEAYAAALTDAGNHVRLRREGALVHGFINMVDLSTVARAALIEAAAEARTMLAGMAEEETR
jgi:acetyl esterase